ncbi:MULTISPECIES: nuclear transport factor 2 family protein [Streptomyces]|uniref:Nuclear transport factor 2 family protein n=1 Tax=Streptomyces salyersiae TaxID=3075530 RepID=A0ABU2RQN5_9ACTN|nr:nuclear transport factor 2 family protein [Streptomyces sp. DSM 41770]MDT0431161.1 nuclear transport factor 2 family protein [Streptomyces sp. DSM 41770]
MSVAAFPSTRTVVKELSRRIGEGDPEGIASLHAERVDWKLDWPETDLGRTATPWIRPRSTRVDVAAHYRELGEHHVPEGAASEIDRFLFDGDDAVMLGEIRRTARPTRRAYRARFAPHLTAEGGLVTRHHVYEDSLAVARASEAEQG